MKRSSFTWKGYTISYIEEGKGQPLLFIHAFPFNALMWEPQLKAHSDTYHVLALDLPGLGESRPIPHALTMELGADAAAALLDHLSIQKTSLCGLSMGGYTALAFAQQHPHRFTSLLLADTHAGADSPEKKQQRQQFIRQIQNQQTEALLDQFVGSTIGRTTKEKHPEIVTQTRKIMAMAAPKAIASALRGMAQRPDRFSVLQKLAVPLLVIVGEEDTLTPLSDAEFMADACPDAQVKVIPYAGHMSNLEQPQRFNQVIQGFLVKNA